jgi:hypothetical protein
MKLEFAQMNGGGCAQIKVVKVALAYTFGCGVDSDYILRERRSTAAADAARLHDVLRYGVVANKVDHYGRRHDL